MSSETPESETVPVEEFEHPAAAVSISPRLILLAMFTGLIGVLLMTPLLLGVPLVLGVFEAEPLVEFANIGSFFGLQADIIGPMFGISPNLILGGLLFAFGGVLFLPVQFLVVGEFLPPESPRFVRGGTFAMLWLAGFLFAFWPGGGVVTIASFVVVAVVSHLIYGLTLGYLIDRWAEIPMHQV